ncbi:MAG: sulfurtransferase [Thiothrix nivea]|nr:MAG: sulfurtransferase [Thiothrix nivea]
MFDVDEIDAQGLKALLDEGRKVRLIDVRSSAEFNQGIIEGAEFMPLHTVPLQINGLANREDETLVIYCRSGNRSAQACLYLKQNADIDALNLRGGIISWYQSGNAVVPPVTV